tara:strand:+ start:2555 stop:3226 length:672 start_codon:yes stop_codon:yes gene_type:complete
MSTFVKQFVVAEPKKNSGPPFCYQQGDNDCGYYSLRIAAEVALGRKFNSAETKIFRENFLSLCLMSGERLEKSTEEFVALFPEMGVYFATEEATEYSPETIIDKLDAGEQVLVLNIQNMSFRGRSFIRGRYGHNVCCVGHKDGKLVFADSNRQSGSCRKTMDISILQSGYDSIKSAVANSPDELEARTKVMRTHPTHISEVYWVTRDRPLKKVRKLRRSRRRG